MRLTLLAILAVLLFSCGKEEEINTIKTRKGGYAILVVKSGTEPWDSVIINTRLSASSAGLYCIPPYQYILSLDSTDANGKLVGNLLLDFTYRTGNISSNVNQGHYILNDGSRYAGTYQIYRNTSNPIYAFRDTTVGDTVSADFSFTSPNKTGGYYLIQGHFSAYRLPDSE